MICTLLFWWHTYTSDLEGEQFIMDENEEETEEENILPDEDEQHIATEDEHDGATSEPGAQASHGSVPTKHNVTLVCMSWFARNMVIDD